MTNCKFIFSSDIHGNKVQLNKLFDYAIKEKINNIVLGGDICPKDPNNRTIIGQKKFLSLLIKSVKKHKELNIYLILGNDDFKANDRILKKNKTINYINLRNVKFCKDFSIFGFSYIAPTPFKFKDWELWDTANKKEDSLRGNFVTKGIKSKNGKFSDFNMNKLNHKKNVYSLLKQKTKKLNMKKTIFVIHTPPHNTKIDICKTKEHVGSIGVRRFIEEKKPILTLHGHIHEAYELSGTYYDKIKDTFVINSCNDYLSNNIALIIVEITNNKIIHKRIII